MGKNISINQETAMSLYEEGGAEMRAFLEKYDTKQELTGLVSSWEDLQIIDGYFIQQGWEVEHCSNLTTLSYNKNVYKTEAQARSALAMAQLSQLMYEFNGSSGWNCRSGEGYCITCVGDSLLTAPYTVTYQFLAFPSEDLAEEFLKLHKELIKDYFEIEQ